MSELSKLPNELITQNSEKAAAINRELNCKKLQAEVLIILSSTKIVSRDLFL